MLNTYRLGIGIMLFNKRGEVLICQRAVLPSAWGMPTGGIDGKETPRETLYREAMEEIGTTNFKFIAESNNWLKCDYPTESCKKWWNGKCIGQKQKWFLLEFLGQDSEININTIKPEFADWKWINIDDLEKTVVEFKKPLYQNIVKEFKPLISDHFNEVI